MRTKLKSIEASIVIVNHNAQRFLFDCILTIYKTLKDIEYEIIVVDNHSNDNSVRMIRDKFPEVKLIVNKINLGYAKANNQGITIAKGDFIILLNPDTIILNDSIKKMLDYAKRNENVGVIGCQILNPGNKLQWDSCGTFLSPLTLFFKELALEKIMPNSQFFGKRLMYYWKRTTSQYVDWVSGVCMIIRKETIRKIGMLDERFFAYMEDMDFCRRARQKNWKVFFMHDAKILHLLSASWRNYPSEQLFTSLHSEKLYLEKYYNIFGVIAFYFGHLVGSGWRFIFHILQKNRTKALFHYMILSRVFKNQI